MITVAELRRRVSKTNTELVANEVLTEQRPVLAELNADQLLRGLRADGQLLPFYKSDSYARKKRAMNSRPPSGVMDLKLTGEFHKSIETIIEAPEIIFGAQDRYELMERPGIGPEILGLTEDSLKKYIAIWFNRFKQLYSNATGLEFK